MRPSRSGDQGLYGRANLKAFGAVVSQRLQRRLWLALRNRLLQPLDSCDCRLVLPDTNHQPSTFFKGRGMTSISLDVLADLGLPVGAVRCREGAMCRAAVPEASVDKYRDLLARKDQVWADAAALGWLNRKVNPVSEPCFVGGSSNSHLRPGVPATIRAHNPASCFRHVSPAPMRSLI